MAKVHIKFWHRDYSETDVIRELEDYPQKDDLILFKDKWYKVISRGFDLDTGKYTKVHCEQHGCN